MTLFEEICSKERLLEGAHKMFRVAPYKSKRFFDKANAFKKNLIPKIGEISSQLSSGHFSFEYKGAFLGHTGSFQNKRRGITLMRAEDYVVQCSLLECCRNEFNRHINHESSYCRPAEKNKIKHGPFECISNIRNTLSYCEYGWETDLVNFFGNMDWQKTINRIAEIIPCYRTIELFEKVVTSPVITPVDATKLEVEKYWNPKKGVRQGSCLSPVLANLYLEQLDKLVLPNTKLFRYVDDLIILSKTSADLAESKRMILEKLDVLGVKAHPEGTQKTKRFLSTEEFKFLGIEFANKRTRIPERASDKFRSRIDEICLDNNLSFGKRIEKVEAFATGWASYYQMAQVSSSQANKYDNIVAHAIVSIIDRAGGKLTFNQARSSGLAPQVGRLLRKGKAPPAEQIQAMSEDGDEPDSIGVGN